MSQAARAGSISNLPLPISSSSSTISSSLPTSSSQPDDVAFSPPPFSLFPERPDGELLSGSQSSSSVREEAISKTYQWLLQIPGYIKTGNERTQLRTCKSFGEVRRLVQHELQRVGRLRLDPLVITVQPENEVDFRRFLLEQCENDDVRRGYEALAVGSHWTGTYQHRSMQGYTFPYELEILQRDGEVLLARQSVDFPPAMGGKTSELLFDMRIVQISQPKFENASPSGLYVEVVNTDKDRLQYSWRLSGSAEHSSLRLSCTLQGNTGVQDFIAYRKSQPDERRSNPKDGNDQDASDNDGNDRRGNATTSFASASERTSFSACSIQ